MKALKILKFALPIALAIPLGFILDRLLFSDLPWTAIIEESFGNQKRLIIIGILTIYVLLVIMIYRVLAKKFSTAIAILIVVSLSLLLCALGLMSIEPIISLDSVEYGFRQQLNQILERIGYAKFNMIVYGAFLIPVFVVLLSENLIKTKEVVVRNDVYDQE